MALFKTHLSILRVLLTLILLVQRSESNRSAKFRHPFKESNSLDPVLSQYSAYSLQINRLPRADTDEDGLQCYKCNGFEDCGETWKKMEADPKDASIIETCQESLGHDHCVLHFSTRIKEDPTAVIETILNDGEMYIDQAGCKASAASFDPSKGCTTTELIIQHEDSEPNDKGEVIQKFVGTHGTHECGCDSSLCNTNAAECHICKHIKDNNCVGTELLDSRVTASECWIESSTEVKIVNRKTVISNKLAGGHRVLKYVKDPDPMCPPEFKAEEWEDSTTGHIIPKKCTCSGYMLCNIVVAQVAAYFNTANSVCKYCSKHAAGCHRKTRKCVSPGEFCSIKYTLTQGKYVLDKLGCQVPPKNKNGDDKPRGWSGCTKAKGGSRTCQCGYDKCNDYYFFCYVCTTPEECKDMDDDNIEQCETLEHEKPKKKECFISYDETGGSLKVEAGCRNSTFNHDTGAGKDPECTDEDLFTDWVKKSKSKESCQCDSTHCNIGVTDLVHKLEEPSRPTEKPETEPPPTEPGLSYASCFSEPRCHKDAKPRKQRTACKMEAKDLKKIDCTHGCEYTTYVVDNENEEKTYMRTCAPGTNNDWDGDGIKCIKKMGGNDVILEKCFCSEEDCNSPENDADFDEKLKDEEGPARKHRRREASSSTRGIGQSGMIFVAIALSFL